MGKRRRRAEKLGRLNVVLAPGRSEEQVFFSATSRRGACCPLTAVAPPSPAPARPLRPGSPIPGRGRRRLAGNYCQRARGGSGVGEPEGGGLRGGERA